MNCEDPKRGGVYYEDEIDLFEYVAILLKYWKKLLLVSLAGGLATHLYIILTMTPVATTTKVELAAESGNVTSEPLVVSSKRLEEAVKLGKDIEQIKSDLRLLKDTIELSKNVSLEGKN